MIKKLEEIKEEVGWDYDVELTDYAQEKAYIAIDVAIDFYRKIKARKITDKIDELLKEYENGK